MIQVNVQRLIEAVQEADAFTLPSMSDGADYIYNSLYRRLTQGEDVRLSEINFDAFELDDVDAMRELYSDVLEVDEYKTETIARSLRGLSPVAAAAAFI